MDTYPVVLKLCPKKQSMIFLDRDEPVRKKGSINVSI